MSAPDDPAHPRPVDRRKVTVGGLVGLMIGVLLFVLALFFLITGFDEPEEVLGVFLPLAVSLIALALGVGALIPLHWGDSPEHSPRVMALAWVSLAVLGLLVTAAGVLRGSLPWTLFAVAPVFSVGALLKDSRRLLEFSRTAGSGGAADGLS